MSAKFFLDTNTIVYSFDNKDAFKRRISQQLIQLALQTRQGHISYQVVQEFLNVATRKFAIPLIHPKSSAYLRDVLSPICTVFPNMALYEKALQIHDRWKFSFYDSLIIAAAISADCAMLYSEDLQHKQTIEHLTIINPFVEHDAVHDRIAEYQVVISST